MKYVGVITVGYDGRVRSVFLVLVVAAIAACTDTSGLSGPDETLADGGTKPSDGGDSVDGGGTGDGGGPGPTGRCDPAKAFDPPVLVTELDAQFDFVKTAVLSKDELEVFFLRYDSSASNWILRRATRATRDATWGTPADITISPTPDGFLSLTAGGKKLYFWTIDANFKMTRATTTETFTAPTKFGSDGAPAPFVVEADDLAYFSRFEGDATIVRRIVRGQVTSGGFTSLVTYVPNIWVDGAEDSNPVLNASETALYFSSKRAGTVGLADIWVARRPTKATEFGGAVHVRELSTDAPDTLTWVSDDDCVAMLDRASHIYVAKKPL